MGKLQDEMAALATMSPAQLREKWQRLARAPVPKISPSLLKLALAYELQAQAFGGLSRTTQQRLAQLASAKTRTSLAQPGMRLVREWNGKVHVVIIGESGTILWNDREWRSLSEVAREITGSRWSGPAFFGLKQKVAA